MDPPHRQQLIDELLRLSRGDLDNVISEVRRRETVEEAGVRALAEAFALREVANPFAHAATEEE